jgi:LPS-assembly protein
MDEACQIIAPGTVQTFGETNGDDAVEVVELTDGDTTDVVEMTSGDASISGTGDAKFTGPIELRSGNRTLTAGNASFESATSNFTVTDNVRFQDPESRVSGDSASYNTVTGQFVFKEAEFELQGVPARGTASEININRSGTLVLKKVSYTTCAVGNNAWMLRAGEIEIDQAKGVGTARHARLALKGVPVFYWPYFTYPVTDERKSGLLIPDLGTSDPRGFELVFPYYWNIAPQYDATFVPRYMSKRGLQLGSEFRYLTERNDGVLWGDYLPDDDRSGTDRWRYLVLAQSVLGRGWRATADAEGVSDSDYFQDLTNGQASTSQTNLERSLFAEWFNRNWSVLLRYQGYQTIDDAIQPDDEPYQRAPQLAVDGVWTDGLGGLDYRLVTDTTYFYREESVQGLRLHLLPEISRPFERNSFYLTPKAALFHSRYHLDDQTPGSPDSPDVTAPILSLDSGVVLERTTGSKQRWLVTLEPRAQYVYIPFEAQADLPVFDTILPDLTLVQLFRRNRFIGYDRIGDTNQMTLGLTSRFLDTSTGKERLTATLGGTQFFTGRDVVLPGDLPTKDNSSDYIAEIGVNLYRNWNVDAAYQWNTAENETTRAEARLQWRPGQTSVMNLGYRFRRDRLEQADVSFSVPAGDRWNFVGRYSYSLREDEPLDRFLGIEYETCCWGIRMVARREIKRDSGETNNSFSIQLELKNFTSVGNSADSLLERGILSYGEE